MLYITEQGAVVEALGTLAHEQRPDVVVLSGVHDQDIDHLLSTSSLIV